MDALPFWARVVAMVGLPTFLVLVGVLIMLGILGSPLSSLPMIREELRVHHAQTVDDHRKVTRLLRAICRNVAKSEVAATNCEAR